MFKTNRRNILFGFVLGLVGCQPAPQVGSSPESKCIRAGLIRIAAEHPVIFTALMTDDNFAAAAEHAVVKLAKDKGTDLGKLNLKELLQWIYDHREEIVKVLLELLPLFIH